jgi:hypothetical protein
MAEIKEITVVDFIDWCKQQVDLAELSALMTDFGYADDSSETIADALDDAEFKAEFSYLLHKALETPKNYYDQQRANGELTAQDWAEILEAKSKGANLTNGFGWADGWDLAKNAIDGILHPVIPETPKQKADRLAKEAADKKAATFTWIIVAVVVIAVIAVLILATRKK